MKTKKWKWYGLPGHFICAYDCLFHLCTEVGDFLISTVGDYHPLNVKTGKKSDEKMEIGYGRYYETFVFSLKNGSRCEDKKCGCEMIEPGSWSEIDSLAAQTAGEANKNHMKMCYKYDKLKIEDIEQQSLDDSTGMTADERDWLG